MKAWNTWERVLLALLILLLVVFGMALTMEDVLVRGTYQGAKRIAGIKCGVVQLDWAYNPMPPVPLQIYPPVPVQTVTEF